MEAVAAMVMSGGRGGNSSSISSSKHFKLNCYYFIILSNVGDYKCESTTVH